MNASALQDGLTSLRRRLLLIGGSAALGWGLVVALVTLLVCAWLDLALDLPAQARAACGLAALTAAVALACRLVWLLRSRTSQAAVAQRLDEAAGGRGQILSGVDLLMNQPRASGPGGAMTMGLAQIAVERAAALAARVSAAAAAPAKPLRRPFAAAALAVGFVMFVALIAPRLVATQIARFTDPFGDHPPYSAITFNVDPGHASIIYGSPLEVHATAAGGTVESAELVLLTEGGAEESLPMFPEAGGWRATVASVTSPGRYFVRGAGTRTKRFEVAVITVPELKDVRFRVTPPAYTHRPPYEGPLPQGGLAGLPGTRVELWATSNRPLSGGQLTFAPDQSGATAPAATSTSQPVPASGPKHAPLTPVADGASEVLGSFTITAPGRIEVGVVDVGGQQSRQPFTAAVTVLPDERPFVRMMEPKENSFATPDVALPVETLAEDDYGVSRVQVYRSLNSSRARPQDLAAPTPEPTRFPTAVTLPLAQYGLKPGDVVKLYARVEDNDPAGAKGSESKVVTLQIISAEQMRQMQLTQQGLEVLASKYEEAARRMEALDAEIEKLLKEVEKLDQGTEMTPEQLKGLAEAAKRAEQDAQALRESAKDVLPFDLDKNLSPQIEEIAKRFDGAAEGFGGLSKEKGLKARQVKQAMEELRRRLGAQRKQFQEKAAEPMQHLEKIFPLKEDEARFTELYQRQRDLADRMHSLAQDGTAGDDPQKKSRMRDLEAEQRKLREAMADLLNDIEDHVAALPDDPQLDDLRETSKKFAEALRQSGASEKMSEAEQSLSAFAGREAHAGAKEAADIMEKFLSQCQGMGDQASQCLKFSPGLSESLGNTVQQLLDAAGLGSNPGMGAGNGGGYSARRSTLDNVGMYGGRPTRATWAKSGSGRRRDGGGAGDQAGADPDADPADRAGEIDKLRATGQSDTVVPARYRRRVGDYFQRVADEIGE